MGEEGGKKGGEEGGEEGVERRVERKNRMKNRDKLKCHDIIERLKGTDWPNPQMLSSSPLT